MNQAVTIPQVPSMPRRHTPVRLALLATLLLAAGQDALAQSNLRSTFPGRRVGGGTRGECTARVLAHLVPASSVFAPGTDRTLGLLQGPTANPVPLQLEFRPPGDTAGGAGAASRRDLPAAPAGITLFSLAATPIPSVWASSYRCGGDEAGGGGADPLDFVQSAAPPALSLVVSDVTTDDRTAQAALVRLSKACGATVPLQDVVQAFGLADVISADWPATLPVRCF